MPAWLTDSLPARIAAVWLPLLLDASFKGALLFLLASVANCLLRRSSAAARHLVWMLALCGFLCLPILSVLLPGWSILPSSIDATTAWRSASGEEEQPGRVQSDLSRSAEPERIDDVEGPGRAASRKATAHTSALPSNVADRRALEAVSLQNTVSGWRESTSERERSRTSRSGLITIALLGWLAGVLFVITRFGCGLRHLRRLERSAMPVSDVAWRKLLEQASEQLGIRPRVALLMSSNCTMPMIWGLLRPRVLLPTEAVGWPEAQRRSVLWHELGHISRRDILTQRIAELTLALYWFHPLLWLAKIRMETEREYACDDLVLASGTASHDLAEHLVEVASRIQSPYAGAQRALAMAWPCRLESRILAILDEGRNRQSICRKWLIIGIMISFGLLIPVAVMRPAVRGQEAEGAALQAIGAATPSLKADDPSQPQFAANAPTDPRADAAGAGDDTKAADPITPLPGVVAVPEKLPGTKRWQMALRSPLAGTTSLAWSPDNSHIAFCESLSIRIHEAQSLKLVRILVGHTGLVTSVAWSPDGNRIISGSEDQTVRIWKPDGTSERTLRGHQAPVTSVAWARDGKAIASGCENGTIRLWPADGTSPVLELQGHPASVRCLAWSPEGKRLASVGGDTKVRLWGADGKLQEVLEGHALNVTAVAWSPRGDMLASGDWADGKERYFPGTVRLWKLDGTPSTVLGRNGFGGVVSISWNPDGRQIASVGQEPGLRIWNIDEATGRFLAGGQGECQAVAWSPDGKRIAMGGLTSSVRFWSSDGTPGPEIGKRDGSTVWAVAWSSDGQSVISGGTDGIVRKWDWSGSPQAESRAQRMADVQPQSVQRGSILSLDWNHDNTKFAAGLDNGTLVFRTRDMLWIREIAAHEGWIWSVSFSPDGRRLATASQDGTVKVWDNVGNQERVLTGHQRAVHSVAWSPDSKRLVSGSLDGTVRLWGIDGSAQGVLKGHDAWVIAVDWSRDGQWIASGGLDNNVRLWTPDGQPGPVLQGHTREIRSVAWSPDSQQIASGSWDNTIRLWKKDGKPLAVLRGHESWVYPVKWRPDSKKIVSGGLDGTIRVWNTEQQQTEWTGFAMSEKNSLSVSASGKLLAAEMESLEREFVYLVETPTGAVDIVPPSEFFQRVGRSLLGN